MDNVLSVHCAYLAREVSYTSPELERSQLTGQPIDTQKNFGTQLTLQYEHRPDGIHRSDDVDAQGLLNNDQVTNVDDVQMA